MTKIIELDFGLIHIHDQILVAELHEGVLLDVKNNRKILQLGQDQFSNLPFGYISHRINSYAVDPMVYRESAEFSPLKAIAIVSRNEMALKSARLEQEFYTNKNSFAIFDDLEEAMPWMKKVLSGYSNEKEFRS